MQKNKKLSCATAFDKKRTPLHDRILVSCRRDCGTNDGNTGNIHAAMAENTAPLGGKSASS